MNHCVRHLFVSFEFYPLSWQSLCVSGHMICQAKVLELKLQILGLVLLFALGVLPLLADQSVILGWQPSLDPNAIGYNIYYGTTSHSYTSKLSVGNVTNTSISGLVLGNVYYFAATTYDGLNQESKFSNEASFAVTKPKLSIVSPTLNQQWSNGTFTVTGSAGDNVAVGHVFYSLNGSAWTNATTVNNWTNWSGALALTPGTNTLQAYALDTSGNPSTTNTVTFEYIVLQPLAIQVSGLGVSNPKWGSLSSGSYTTWVLLGSHYYITSGQLPGYTNGTLLAVNQNYALTATANAGFAFTNWSDGHGNILTNGPTLRFTMATNLALNANFLDITKPKLSIVSPTLNQQWSNGTFTVTGSAGDNVAVGHVFYSLNGSAWTNATTVNNWTNWSGALALTPGTNTLQAYALDTSGNPSTTNTVTFEYIVLQPLAIQVSGLGVSNPKWGSLSSGSYTTWVLLGSHYYITSASSPLHQRHTAGRQPKLCPHRHGQCRLCLHQLVRWPRQHLDQRPDASFHHGHQPGPQRQLPRHHQAEVEHRLSHAQPAMEQWHFHGHGQRRGQCRRWPCVLFP